MIRRVCRVPALALALLLGAGATPSLAQTNPEVLRIDGLFPVGGRASLTEAWGTLRFGIDNLGDTSKLARVAVFYTNQPEVQFVREVWVPARTRIESWITVGPAPPATTETYRDLSYQLFDKTDGSSRIVHSSQLDRVPSRVVMYRKREPSTAIYVDAPGDNAWDADPLDDPQSPTSEQLRAAQVFRHVRGLSDQVSVIRDRYLPPTVEAFDGIDLLILGSNRLAADTSGQQALRHWVLQGGTLWVLLDRVDPEVIAPILGEGLRFQVVGRTSLSTVKIRSTRQERSQVEKTEFDQPVDLVQVALSGTETPHYDANDWPAAFSQSVGKGRVYFTTLGLRAWTRKRMERDGPSKFKKVPGLPAATAPFEMLAYKLHPETKSEELSEEDLAPVLAAEIGYEIAGRRTAALILLGYFAALLVLALVLRRARVSERIGLFAPVVAIATMGVFLLIGQISRSATPSTAAAVAVVTVSPETGEEEWSGLFGIYSPTSGPVELQTEHGGQVDFGQKGLEGQTRSRVETDLNAWHWENLSFPVGVRMGSVRATLSTGVAATAHFGSAGLEGQIKLGTYHDLTDAVFQARSGALYSVRLNSDGRFQVTTDDRLPDGQFIPGTVLTDRQQRRQSLYRKLLPPAKPGTNREADQLYVWAETRDLPFKVPSAQRSAGMVLLVIPVQFEFKSGTSFTIPSGFLPYTMVSEGMVLAPKFDGTDPKVIRLRFQLPDWGQPFVVERLSLMVRAKTPGRRFGLRGLINDKPGSITEEFAPPAPVRLEMTEAQQIQPDRNGGIWIEMLVSERTGSDGRDNPMKTTEAPLKWEIESVNLGVSGRLTRE